MHLIDDLGAEVPLRAEPARVVSLVPALTEALEHSAPGRLAAATTYCTYPPGLDVPRIGGSKYPTVAAVLDLQPDLVLANSEENRPDDVAQLRAAGIPVWVTEAPATVPDALGSLRRLLSQAFLLPEQGWLAEAERVWSFPRPHRARALVPVWRKPWVVLGRDTFAGDVLGRLGVATAYADDPQRYPRPKIAELRERCAADGVELLVLPDEPYEFTEDDGPGFFPDLPYVLISGRYLTWYGPSLVSAHRELSEKLDRVLDPA